jgi:hypothetical protein
MIIFPKLEVYKKKIEQLQAENIDNQATINGYEEQMESQEQEIERLKACIGWVCSKTERQSIRDACEQALKEKDNERNGNY